MLYCASAHCALLKARFAFNWCCSKEALEVYAKEAHLLCRCVRNLQEAGLKVLADIVINHRCAHAQVALVPSGGPACWSACN